MAKQADFYQTQFGVFILLKLRAGVIQETRYQGDVHASSDCQVCATEGVKFKLW